MFQWLKRKLWRGHGREDSDLGFGTVPDPGLSNHNLFRQWIGIYQLLDRSARERGGVASERPADERMLYIARGLMRYNSYAQGFIGSLRTHVLGANGLVHNATGPSAKAVNSFLKKWKDETDWWQREREIYERVHIEGEAVPRFFLDSGCVELRMVEPEWIVAPDGSKEWTFGFYNEPGDVETVTALWALYGDSGGELVEWQDWYHVKSKLSVRADKRGRSDFLSVAPLLDDSFKVWRNFVRSEAIRQSIIYFAEQAPGVTSDDLEQAIAAESDYTPPATQTTKPPTQLVDSSGVEYLQSGTKLSSVPAAESVQGVMTGVNAALLAVGRPYNMPLVLISGDMSANNTLDFGDESPFGTAVGDEQNWYCRHVRNILWRVVELAAEESDSLSEALYDGTNLEVTSERKPARDAEKNTTRAKTLYDDGVISGRERSAMEGVDYNEQQAQRQREGLSRLGQQQPMPGLEETVIKEVEVHRGGKTFLQHRRVSVDSGEGEKPGGLKSVRKLVKTEKDAVAKDYLEAALENSDGSPEDVAQQLASMYSMAHDKGHHTATGPLSRALAHMGADLEGPDEGKTVKFSNKLYEAPSGIGPGDNVKVVKQPVVLDGKVLAKGSVAATAKEEAGDLVEKEVTVHRGGKTFH